MNPLNNKRSKYQLFSIYFEISVSYIEANGIQRKYVPLGIHSDIILDYWIFLLPSGSPIIVYASHIFI